MKAIDVELNGFWNNFSWQAARDFLGQGPDILASALSTARQRTIRVFGDRVKLFFPGSNFPAISITGDQCKLECRHCNKKYLKHMKPAVTPDALVALARRLDARGAVGCLISGGCDATGSVPLAPFLDAIGTIKRETRLVLNLHTGFLTPEVAKRLGEIGVDVVSFDVNGSAETVRDIYHLQRPIADYEESMRLLHVNKVHFVPHVCIGLHFGELKGEAAALETIAKFVPQTIVFIILIPPAEGPYKAQFRVPDPDDVARIFCVARAAFPKTELFLGCMRPGGRVKHAIERRAFEAGASSIVIPSRETQMMLAKAGIPTTKYNSCCAIPPSLYDKALQK